jgi:hypothetical protein
MVQLRVGQTEKPLQRHLATKHRVLATVAILALTSALPARAASVYSPWLKVQSIEYLASTDAYLIGFEGTVRTDELDADGSPCTIYSKAVIRESTKGVATDAKDVDRMVSQLFFAKATGQRVRAVVHQCDTFNNSATRPKIYDLITQD